ncbi:MAG: hypothetical protein V2I33_21265 [Kangiellaceae bacterium]|jgi:hypothetical protein|nr:hypothetical protein [Kangiellaceae bacterium]
MKYPELVRQDTIRDTVPAIVTNTRLDTVLIRRTEVDTFLLEKDRLRVRTILRHDTIIQEAECLGDTILVPLQIPCTTIQPTKYVALPLKWWQKALMFLGAVFIAVIAFRFIQPRITN